MPKSLARILNVALVCLFNGSGIAQEWEAPRTEFDQPDMQGVWYYGSATPVERPAELGTKRSYTEEESRKVIADLSAAETEKEQPLDPSRAAPATGATIAQEADHNFASIRTNLITIDGLIPHFPDS